MRIGHGYDVHRTDATREMFIGGVCNRNESDIIDRNSKRI